jgi:hypothetical protein
MQAFYIYTLKDPETQEVKYVGKTKNLKPIIEVLDIGSEENINELEIYWIAQLKAWGFNLTNMTDGGDGRSSFGQTGRVCSEEKKTKMMLNHPNRKVVVQLDKDRNIVKQYASIKEAARQTGFHKTHISRCYIKFTFTFSYSHSFYVR